MKLTKRSIDAMKYDGDGKSRDVRWDSSISGYGLRIYPSGKKSFVLSYRANGRKRLLTIGSYGKLTADQAKKKAKEFSVIVMNGDDPLDQRQRSNQESTIKELCEAYIERYAKLEKKSWKVDERRINQHILPVWGTQKASKIRFVDVATLHAKIGKNHPYEANRVASLLSKMFNEARKMGFVPEENMNPAYGINRFKEVSRDTWVEPEELPMLAEAIDQDENIYARHALWLYLLTGVRKTELLTAKWEDVNWNRKELKLPDTKAGRVHYVPLSEPALKLLSDIPRIEENPYILPGHKKGFHLVNIDKPWRRIRDRATVKLWMVSDNEQLQSLIKKLSIQFDRAPTIKEIKDAASFELPSGMLELRLHDLRRTVGSWLAQAGNSLHLIGKVLNHSNQATTAVYARFGQDQVRQALDQHGERIMGVAGKKNSAEIIDIESVK